jgi:hypothetical protein
MALASPPSLRVFLDAGCDITTLPGWRSLAKSVLLFDGDDQLRKVCVDSFRRWVSRWLEQSERVGDIGVEQAALTRYLWQAEALEDPEMATRLRNALPEAFRVGAVDGGRGSGGVGREPASILGPGRASAVAVWRRH